LEESDCGYHACSARSSQRLFNLWLVGDRLPVPAAAAPQGVKPDGWLTLDGTTGQVISQCGTMTAFPPCASNAYLLTKDATDLDATEFGCVEFGQAGVRHG
jgi:hypothetical protein